MGLFSKFRENAGDGVKGEQQSSGETEAVGLIGVLENVREAVLGSGVEGDGSALSRGLAMEDPFGQSDHVLAAVVEHDVRASGSSEERKTIVQTVRESLTQSAHVVRDAVLSHTTADQANGDGQFAHAATPIEDDGAPEEQSRGIIAAVGDIMAHPVQTMKDMIGSHHQQANGDSEFAQAATPIEDGVASEEQSRGIIASVGDIMAHPVQTMKDMIGSHSDVVEASSGECSAGGAGAEQASTGVSDLASAAERGEEEEVKGLIQTVKDAAMEVKEEMLEVVQEVKDVVLSSDTLSNVQTESITEDAGERPSMELVHTIVHD